VRENEILLRNCAVSHLRGNTVRNRDATALQDVTKMSRGAKGSWQVKPDKYLNILKLDERSCDVFATGSDLQRGPQAIICSKRVSPVE